MKIIFYLGIICAFVLFVASSDGRAANGSGNTGAPGDESVGQTMITCKFCHTNSNIVTTTNISVLDKEGLSVTMYEPGIEYRVRVSVNATSGTPQRYGFQLIGLRDSDSLDLKAFSNPDTNVKLSTINHTDRTYAEHKSPVTSNTFEVSWTAPEAGTGSVSFYAGGNGVNRNGSTSGDGASESKITLQEAIVSGSAEYELLVQKIQVYPNPITHGKVFIHREATLNISNISLYDSSGKLHADVQVNDSEKISLDLPNVPAGIYFLSIDMPDQALPIRKTILIR